MIITGGENIFPVEIEDFLMENSNIQDAAVIGIPDERLGEITAAIIKVKPGKELSEEDVMNYCEGLPRYKRPRKVFFDDVPRNPTGKIEKPKLRKKYAGRIESFKV
jgi:acyl-CoA synthetase (AMP-forming)/AMP-acid ligase II